jgi:uncharacterized protein (TIGR02246 family)
MIKERLEATDIAKIYQLWNEYADSINSVNLEHLLSLWQTDGILLPPYRTQNHGKDEIREYIEVQVIQFGSEFSINPDIVRVLGEYAYSFGSFYSTVMPKVEGVTKPICGKFLSILKKQSDGSWKILADCFNYEDAIDRYKSDPKM